MTFERRFAIGHDEFVVRENDMHGGPEALRVLHRMTGATPWHPGVWAEIGHTPSPLDMEAVLLIAESWLVYKVLGS